MTESRKKRSVQLFALLVIVLFFNLPIVSALQISSVRAEDVTQTGAVIKWNTDERADSFVSYGTDATALQTIGDANSVVNHSLAVIGLTPQTDYKFKVESAGTIDDNGGSLYSFSTLAPDTTAPELKAELPERIAGVELSVEGTTEAGVTINIYVDGSLAGSTSAIPVTTGDATSMEGTFTFASVVLTPDQDNVIKIEAKDVAGNVAGVEGNVFADTERPTVEIGNIPEVAAESSIEVNGTISEPATFEIFVGEDSVAKGEGQVIKETVRLEEGKNTIKIVVKDLAGWEVTKEFEVSSDTQPPHVTFKLEEGNEYYQGRADTNLNGETEPGADVFLYVYRPLGYEFTPKFDKAWAKTTADEKGEFTFDVDFEDEPVLELLKGLKPKQVPSGLQEYSIFSTRQVAEQQQFTYYVFVIAEDKSGKSGFLQQTVNVNTCFSGNFDFDVQSVAYLQAPLRLDPRLLDEGRETITATFNMSYRGNGRPDIDRASGREIRPGFEITQVQFEKACTTGMQDDESFKVSCQILPAGPQIHQSNTDKTAWFVGYNLHGAAEMSEKKEDFWNEFKKRRIVFPLKVRISYREREATGNYGPMKTQASCIDLGYFIDIPVDSKDMLPDFIADEGLEIITATIEKIDTVMPYLEKAIIVTGIGAISTFLLKMVVRWTRLTTSKLESHFSVLNPDNSKKCPTNQDGYHLRSTIEHWKKLEEKGLLKDANLPSRNIDNKDKWKEMILDDACPNTANLWKTEAIFDQGLKWTWDRFFCRAVPAAWTSTKEKQDVDAVIISQNQCTASTRGIPLKLVENCQERVAKDVVISQSAEYTRLKSKGAFPCYENPVDNQLYYIDERSKGAVDKPEVVKLKWIAPTAFGLESAFSGHKEGEELFAFKPPHSKDILIGTQQTCDDLCKNTRRSGFKADKDNGIESYYNSKPGNYGCYKEVPDSGSPGGIQLQGKGKNPLKGADKFPAGMYTADCFVDVDASGKEIPHLEGETGLLQCVCAPDKEAEPRRFGAREAIKETEDGVYEEWDYREEAIFKSSNGAYGTYYPEWRYYKGRDFSSSFGQNYVLDAITPGSPPKVHKVDPFNQHISTFQTMCLTGVRARLVTLRSILEGLRGCIQEAKITGLHDAGMCKTIFSQQVCGLLYKAIAYFFTQCSPYSVTDGDKGTAIDDIGAVFQAGFSSIPEAMESSIKDAQSDYGNAKLNEFFATGAQGFAQSICMAAFGYDWPMGMDFITDAAYAFPTKTNVVVMPAGRELSTYNPMKGTAIFNYEVGVTIIPGCKIRSYDVSLKCVGPEDKGHPGIQCGTQGCDCLQATENSGVENEKTKPLDGGRGFDLKSGQVFSPPITAPQKVDMNYKYDHVVVNLKLDPYEDPDKCFDDGYKDGLFYFPITDISAPGEAVCQVQPFTGRYTCPALLSQFGGGSGAYLEDPFVSCYDKNTNTWTRCNTPNLFVKDDPVKIKAHIVTNGGKFCLDTKVSGITADPRSEIPRDIPENAQGSYGIEIPLGTVDEGMLGSTENTLIRDVDGDPACSSDITFDSRPSGNINIKAYRFNFAKGTDGKYSVQVDAGITIDIANSRYTINNLKLVDKNNPNQDVSLTADELKSIPFMFDGFKVRGLIGAPSGTAAKNSCVYRSIHASGAGLTQNQRSFSVTVRVTQPDAGGGCFNVNVPVRAPAYGEASHTETIIVQRQSVVTQIASRLHQEFKNNNCQYVQQAARQLINRQQSDMDDVTALYYSIACYIIQGGAVAVDGTGGWPNRFKTDIGNLLTIFFKRQYNDGTSARPYAGTMNTNTAEYQKIETYLCCVAENMVPEQKTSLCPSKPSCKTSPK